MFPEFVDTEVETSSGTTGPIPWTYRFDWDARQLVRGLDGRYVKTATYAEYLEEVAKKILNTKRFRYGIYSEGYGVDYLEDLGLMRNHVSLPVIKLQTQEALEAHQEIDRAEVMDIAFTDKGITFSLEITGVRGETQMEVDVWSR